MIYIIVNCSDIYNSLMVKFSTLPKEYENVKSLKDLYTNSEYSITSFSSINDEYAKIINDSTFYISIDYFEDELPDAINSKFYKINKKTSEIIDSLIVEEETYDNHLYLLNTEKSYYTTWLIDGDTTKKSFNLIGKGKLYSKDDFKKYTDNALYSDYDFIEYSKSNKLYVKTVYLKENRWHEIYTEDDFYVNKYCCKNYDLLTKSIEEMTTLNYFFKTDWNVDIFPDFKFRPYINGRTPDHWEGTAYYTLNTYNNIQFKREEARMYEHNNGIADKRIHKDYQFYEEPSKNFLFVSVRSGTITGSKHYLIQKK